VEELFERLLNMQSEQLKQIVGDAFDSKLETKMDAIVAQCSANSAAQLGVLAAKIDTNIKDTTVRLQKLELEIADIRRQHQQPDNRSDVSTAPPSVRGRAQPVRLPSAQEVDHRICDMKGFPLNTPRATVLAEISRHLDAYPKLKFASAHPVHTRQCSAVGLREQARQRRMEQ
jgi:hypothetical protein